MSSTLSCHIVILESFIVLMGIAVYDAASICLTSASKQNKNNYCIVKL